MLEGLSISTILTSTVIAAIVGGVTSFMQTERSLSAKHITEERSSWRKEIKNAISQLYEAWAKMPYGTEVQKILISIESQLNPYGKYQDAVALKKNAIKYDAEEQNYFLQDGHIWVALNNFRDKQTKRNLHSLIDRLELLLKYDWERSKKEISFNKLWIVTGTLSLAGFIHRFLISPDLIGLYLIVFLTPTLLPFLANNMKFAKTRSIATILFWGYLAVSILIIFVSSWSNGFENIHDAITLAFFIAAFLTSVYSTEESRNWRNVTYFRAINRMVSREDSEELSCAE